MEYNFKLARGYITDFEPNRFCGGSIPTEEGISVCEVESENIKCMNCLKIIAFQGDSGGPFMCKNERRIWTLVGVSTSAASYYTGMVCVLGFFTKVDLYLDFINKGDFKILIIILFNIFLTNYSR